MLGWHGYFHWFPVLLIHHFSYTTLQLGHVFILVFWPVLSVRCCAMVYSLLTSSQSFICIASVIALCIALMPIVASHVGLFFCCLFI